MSDAAATAPPTAKKPARTKQRSHPVDGRLSAQVGNPAGVILKISSGFWKLGAVGEGCFSNLYNLAGHFGI